MLSDVIGRYDLKSFVNKLIPQNFIIIIKFKCIFLCFVLESCASVVLGGTSKKGGKRTKKENNMLKDFGIEYAKSGRAACCGCKQKILKDQIRVRKTVFDTEVGMKFGGQALWHHVECFAQIREELGWFDTGENLPGFESIKDDDKADIKKALP